MPAQRSKRPRGRRIVVPRTPRDPAPVRGQLNTIKQHLVALVQRLLAVEEGLQHLIQSQQNTAKAVIRVEIDLDRATNAQDDRGNIFPWVIVLFNDGRDPTESPFYLPAITSTRAMKRFDVATCNRYLEGYGIRIPPGDGDLKECRRSLQDTIGCRISHV